MEPGSLVQYNILQYFGIIFLTISTLGMIGLIFFSLIKELSIKDRWIVVGVIIGGILIAFLFLLVADLLSDFTKSDLLKDACRLYGVITILISLFSTISISIIAKDNEPNANVTTLLVPASILYIMIGYFFLWYGESLDHPFVLFWFTANGTTFVFAGIGAMTALLIDALSKRIEFKKEYLVISMILSIFLGISLFVFYFLNEPNGQQVGLSHLTQWYKG